MPEKHSALRLTAVALVGFGLLVAVLAFCQAPEAEPRELSGVEFSALVAEFRRQADQLGCDEGFLESWLPEAALLEVDPALVEVKEVSEETLRLIRREVASRADEMAVACRSISSTVERLEEDLLAGLELEPVLFQFDSYVVADGAERERVRRIASMLGERPDIGVVLEGFADSEGQEEYNAVLGCRRSNAVAQLMRDRGFPNSRLSLLTYGWEPTQQIAEGASRNEEGARLNRRVTFSLVAIDERWGSEALCFSDQGVRVAY